MTFVTYTTYVNYRWNKEIVKKDIFTDRRAFERNLIYNHLLASYGEKGEVKDIKIEEEL